MKAEIWIAGALLAVAAVGAAAAVGPRLNFLEESCGPALPAGETVAVRAVDDVVRKERVAHRTIVFSPASWGTEAVLRTCFPRDAQVEEQGGVERAGAAPTVRVVVTAPGPDGERLVEEAEIKMRAVLAGSTLSFVPRIELHGRETLPLLSFVLFVPPGGEGNVEAWP